MLYLRETGAMEMSEMKEKVDIEIESVYTWRNVYRIFWSLYF